MKKIALILFFTINLQSFAIQPAKLHCIDVSSNGDILITWKETSDVVDFISYEIFQSNSLTGPFNLLTTITNPNVINYSHIGASADINTCYYYIKTNGSSSTGFSDTLSSIQLTITCLNDGNALMNWNIPSTPLPSLNSWYHIYREYPTGTWILLDSTQQQSYTENFSICDIQLSYKIILKGTGCTNQSAPDACHIKDLTPPSTPILDSVSVNNTNGKIQLGWDAVSAQDTRGYIIYRQEGGVWTPIDTIYGINSTFYEYSEPNSSTAPQNYRIAAIDSCYNASPLSMDQHSMVLTNSINNCLRTTMLNWNIYDHLPSGVIKYEIFQSENGMPFVNIGEEVSNTTHVVSGLIDGNTYQFFVRAIGLNGFSASSTSVNFVFSETETPKDVYSRYASVNENQHVDLAIWVDTSALITGINIYKKYPNTTFLKLATLAYNSTGNYYFTDTDVATSKEKYSYFAKAIDICGNEILSSDTVTTILLSGDAISEYKSLLTWFPYDEFYATVDNYCIYRSVGASPFFDSISSTTITNYTDDVTSGRYEGAIFNYYVEAQEGLGNPYGFKDVSRSNIIKIGHPSLTFVPNAFSPNGENKIFKPTNIFVDNEEYLFVIFNRSGAKVFETNDPNQGWDGKYLGELQPSAMYVYRLYYLNSNKTRFEKEGWVYLFK